MDFHFKWAVCSPLCKMSLTSLVYMLVVAEVKQVCDGEEVGGMIESLKSRMTERQ